MWLVRRFEVVWSRIGAYHSSQNPNVAHIRSFIFIYTFIQTSTFTRHIFLKSGNKLCVCVCVSMAALDDVYISIRLNLRGPLTPSWPFVTCNTITIYSLCHIYVAIFSTFNCYCVHRVALMPLLREGNVPIMHCTPRRAPPWIYESIKAAMKPSSPFHLNALNRSLKLILIQQLLIGSE